MTRFDDDSEESATLDAAALRHLKVQKVLSLEELARLHTARLARLARNGVDPALWRRLEQCDGSGCPNRDCNAACIFGERREVNRLIRQTRIVLIRSGQPRYFVTIIDPCYFLPAGRLGELSINGVFQGLRRRLRAAPANWNPARIVGAVDIAYNRDPDGREYWSPHVHLVVAVDANKKEVLKVLRPMRAFPPGLVGKKFRPIEVKPVTKLANAIAYPNKPTVAGRAAIQDGRGNIDRKWFRVPETVQLEHDIWMLGMRPRARSFLSGMMVTRGGVSVRKRS
ncbi:hypothetical protein [Mesorhizobium sp.]|uniref:hypothetical protein n=1 Tax=Mesorhizobium sp. TaxID=1871066 RepID=UPI0012192A00|nr:hypothetical protein [Mesorhizobium sp.]TIM05489.1 MAG: hypothetical protein E5Y62_27235 [Mesorhizobium sp.]